uniref:tRNA(His) guanylyltransferase Thg1 family protein n=1 Tax=Clostridium sp. TaxID=1506 RepID=UPI00307C293B
MALRDELGIRMKNFYESVPKTKLLRRTPVAIRIDGKAFHSFTRGMKKPFDFILIESMQKTMQYLCENIQGCVLGYTQSDEITLLLIDYKRLNSDAWFDYEVQKMCSIAASMATMAFNRYFAEAAAAAMEDEVYAEALQKAVQKGAMFDARCFNIPKEEAANLIYWRQLDAARNSVQMVGQANFSHKQLQGKSCEQIQDMLMQEKMFNWNELETCLKRGSCCVRKEN